MNTISSFSFPEGCLNGLFESDPIRDSSRYQEPIRDVTFFCKAPAADRVFVTGDFNHWNPAAAAMRRMPDGGWVLTLALRHGHHQYYFLVDGQPTLDPKAMGTSHNERGESVSLVAVS